MNWLHKHFYALAISALLILPFNAQATYLLDPSFGESGKSIVDISNSDDHAYSMVVQPDGKIILAGMSDNGADKDIVVLRYSSSGSLDTSFNTDGKATFQVGSGDDSANGVIVLEDGAILVAGYSVNAEETKEMVVVKITSSGYLDQDFGLSGVATLAVNAVDMDGLALAADSEGRIVVGGVLKSDTGSMAVAARFLANGSLDTSFGKNGYRTIGGDDSTTAHGVALLKSGKIILAGSKEVDRREKAALFCLSDRGGVEESFGDNGRVVLDSVEGESAYNGVAVLDSGAIVAVGYTTADDHRNMTVVKFSATGQHVVEFGVDGLAVNDQGRDGAAYSVVEKTDDTLLIAGEGENGDDYDISLLHLDSSGNKLSSTVLTVNPGAESSEKGDIVVSPLEVSDGIDLEQYELIAAMEESEAQLTDIDGENDFGRALVILDSGRVLVAGFTFSGKDDDIALLGFVNDVEANADEGLGVSTTEVAYFIATLSVSNITRNSAMSGGVITRNKAFYCDSESTEVCPPTVTGRGVVYGVTPYPSYRSSDETTTETTDESTTEGNSVFPDWVENTSHNYEVVRSGQTSDGSDVGFYGSDIVEITPDETYFVRAYVVLSDETVLYGNQLAFTTDDACFIATAAFGSPLESHVTVLREFRDSYLKTNNIGKKFIRLYYDLSPPLAEYVSQSSLLRFAVRLLLLPLVGLSYFLVHLSLQLKFAIVLMTGSVFLYMRRTLAKR